MSDQRKPAGSGGQQRSSQKGSRPAKTFRHLELVWAKVSGFFHWPGQAVDPTQSYLVPRKLRTPPRPGMFLVKFFGSYDYHWVSKSAIEAYDKGFAKRYHSRSKSKVFLVALQEAKEFEASGKLPEGFFDTAPESDWQSDNPTGNEETSSSSDEVGLLDSLDSSVGSGPKQHLDGTEEKDGDQLQQGSTGHPAWTNEVERSLSIMEQDNGWQVVLASIDMEEDEHRRNARQRCLSAMRLVGLAPPAPYLGEIPNTGVLS